MKKRFIAGAVCQQCKQMDKTILFMSEAGDWIECVECGYTEKRPNEEQLSLLIGKNSLLSEPDAHIRTIEVKTLR